MARWGLVEANPEGPTHQCARGDSAREASVQRSLPEAACIDSGKLVFSSGRSAPTGSNPIDSELRTFTFAFAGLWEFARIAGEEILSAAIIVGAPYPLAAAIHDRMPVILEPADYDRWLADTPVDLLRALSLLKPFPAERMIAEAVNRKFNSVKNDDEECIEPIGEPPLQA